MAEKKKAPDDIPPAPEGLTREETRSVKERRRLRAAVVYEIIRLEGEKELARSFSALWWSALAAGLSIGFSVLSQGMLAALLGDMPGATIIADLGYTVGFLIVILAHQQLFTENTRTAVLPVMVRARYGRIVNISSVVALMGNPGQANYCAAKAGLVGFTKSLAREVASRSITVNAVAPGFIDTEMTRALPGEARDRMAGLIPLGRLGTPEDVAAGVAFLLGPGAAYITGEVLNISGGLYM